MLFDTFSFARNPEEFQSAQEVVICFGKLMFVAEQWHCRWAFTQCEPDIAGGKIPVRLTRQQTMAAAAYAEKREQRIEKNRRCCSKSNELTQSRG